MPVLETMDLKTPMVLWMLSSRDSHGEILISPPVNLLARFVRRRSIGLDREGNPISLDAQAALDRDVILDSIIWEGTIATLPSDSNFTIDKSLYAVSNRSTAEDIKYARFKRYEYGLIRYKGSLPALV